MCFSPGVQYWGFIYKITQILNVKDSVIPNFKESDSPARLSSRNLFDRGLASDRRRKFYARHAQSRRGLSAPIPYFEPLSAHWRNHLNTGSKSASLSKSAAPDTRILLGCRPKPRTCASRATPPPLRACHAEPVLVARSAPELPFPMSGCDPMPKDVCKTPRRYNP